MRHPRVTIAAVGLPAVAAADGINVASADGPPAPPPPQLATVAAPASSSRLARCQATRRSGSSTEGGWLR